eukprot:4704957-Pleurochrysis_carterae.AAC.1
MATPPSAAAAKMFHPSTIPSSNLCFATEARRKSGRIGGHAMARATRGAAERILSDLGPPTVHSDRPLSHGVRCTSETYRSNKVPALLLVTLQYAMKLQMPMHKPASRRYLISSRSAAAWQLVPP